MVFLLRAQRAEGLRVGADKPGFFGRFLFLCWVAVHPLLSHSGE